MPGSRPGMTNLVDLSYVLRRLEQEPSRQRRRCRCMVRKLLLMLGAMALVAQANGAEPSATALKNPADFSSISNTSERSRALFAEIGKLLTSPRCLNCHPAGDHPLQG